MDKYNYLESVTDSVRDQYDEWVSDYDDDIKSDKNALAEQLSNDMWTDDAVTGNASGSYTTNAWQAEEYIAHNWDLIEEMSQELFNNELDILKLGPETVDVYLRCYVLDKAIATVIEEKFEKPESDTSDE